MIGSEEWEADGREKRMSDEALMQPWLKKVRHFKDEGLESTLQELERRQSEHIIELSLIFSFSLKYGI